MLTIYKKQIKKNWLYWVAPSILMAGLAALMAFIWPSFEGAVEAYEAIMSDPFIAGLLGEGASKLGISSFDGLIAMELFIMGDLIFIAFAIAIGILAVTREVDTGTLDMMLGLPVPRWKIIIEKLSAFITISFSYPLFIWIASAVSAAIMNIEWNPVIFFIALVGRWLLLITLTCVVILISVVFMDTSKTLGVSALFLGGSWILERFGGLLRSASEELADFFQGISLFHYLDGAAVMGDMINGEALPYLDFIIVVGIGIIALVLSLLIFQRREFK